MSNPDEDGGGMLDQRRVRTEWPRQRDGSLYFNTGSCGRKPALVLQAITDGWQEFNSNPTYYSFFGTEWLDGARESAARLLAVPSESLMLMQNSTQGLQLALGSFLLNDGDELVMSTHEHRSANTIARYLSETRGIAVAKHASDPLAGSEALCRGLIALVTKNTRLVLVSEIDCFSGWRPNLSILVDWLREREIPLAVDGAHSPGQGICRPSRYPMWLGSGHKWLGGPNGTGLFYATEEMAMRLRPAWSSDDYYSEISNPLRRLEFQGTSDVVRWKGLQSAVHLNLSLGQERIAEHQRWLALYLRQRLSEFPAAHVRTPHVEGETSGMLTVTWKPDDVSVPNLKNYLWDSHKIWTQPDYCYGQEGHGLRISCHVSIDEPDIDRLIEALKPVVR